jgi:glutaredoxin
MPDNTKYIGLVISFEEAVDIDFADTLRKASKLYEGVGEALLIQERTSPYVIVNYNNVDGIDIEELRDELEAAVANIYEKYKRRSNRGAKAVGNCVVEASGIDSKC